MNELVVTTKDKKANKCIGYLNRGYSMDTAISWTNSNTDSKSVFIWLALSSPFLVGILCATKMGFMYEWLAWVLAAVTVATNMKVTGDIISKIEYSETKLLASLTEEETINLKKMDELNLKKEELYAQYKHDAQLFIFNVFGVDSSELMLRVKAGIQSRNAWDCSRLTGAYLYEVANPESSVHQEMKSKINHPTSAPQLQLVTGAKQ